MKKIAAYLLWIGILATFAPPAAGFPYLSGGSPSGTLSAGTTSTTMSVTTNVNASCKYGTSNVAYASLPNFFSATGGTSHSQNISGLVNGGSYSYYVRCQDSLSNANTDDYVISFTVSSSGTAPP